MDKRSAQNMRIMGSSTASGGIYNKVSIMGDGEVTGDIDCHKFSCSGSAVIFGNTIAEEMSVQGTLNAKGSLETRKISVQGEANAQGSVLVQEASINGMFNVGESLRAERLKIRGGVSIKGNCEVERLDTNGCFNIDGMLNVGNLDAKVNWACSAKEIGGEKITVRKGSSIGNVLKFIPALFKVMPDARLTADIIEGDDIELEHTTADVVRGNHVRIGEGCRIGRVEYRHHYTQHENSTVESAIQV
ncbi:polymer-forming cytoskeletal protein [Paenibacillus sp. ACRRX]|uniref:polymer-forming cytoskeletal protein n=1 Tax=unclassified Paenibacillus TaxID=185978 RepID=UPI001EF51D8A|nr:MULTISPECIES: polymer-forming cytoskeletal protein [unclassified Paenibacillus]MCG7408191.1 polymer-forming cytoskeletal protein [Paenibacillus sp. ACRRX]MDK8181426.1 polymer-forming cytoskeletal protein [Paenibacillus sp. UMB4589-SE434]